MRGDHGEVVQLLVGSGAKVFKAKDGGLVELTSSRLSGCALAFLLLTTGGNSTGNRRKPNPCPS